MVQTEQPPYDTDPLSTNRLNASIQKPSNFRFMRVKPSIGHEMYCQTNPSITWIGNPNRRQSLLIIYQGLFRRASLTSTNGRNVSKPNLASNSQTTITGFQRRSTTDLCRAFQRASVFIPQTTTINAINVQ